MSPSVSGASAGSRLEEQGHDMRDPASAYGYTKHGADAALRQWVTDKAGSFSYDGLNPLGIAERTHGMQFLASASGAY